MIKPKRIKKGGNITSNVIASLPWGEIASAVSKHGINAALNYLPLPEIHLIDGTNKYSFCGPFTDLKKRVEFDEKGNVVKVITPPVNELDAGCFLHDIAYEKYKDIDKRNVADDELLKIADHVLNDDNASKKDKWNAFIVKNIMNFKINNKI